MIFTVIEAVFPSVSLTFTFTVWFPEKGFVFWVCRVVPVSKLYAVVWSHTPLSFAVIVKVISPLVGPVVFGVTVLIAGGFLST